MGKLIKRENKVVPTTRFNPNTLSKKDSVVNKGNKKIKYSSLRCTNTTKNKVNALVSINDFENIEDCLVHLLSVFEATLSQEKLQEYEIVQRILDRKTS